MTMVGKTGLLITLSGTGNCIPHASLQIYSNMIIFVAITAALFTFVIGGSLDAAQSSDYEGPGNPTLTV